MLFYNIIFVFLAFLSFIEIFCFFPNFLKKSIIKLFLLVFGILSAFYAGPMGDFNTYKAYFQNTNSSHIWNISQNRFEYGYELINYIIKVIFNNYWSLRLVLAVIVMSIWYKIIFYADKNQKLKISYPITFLFVLWALNFGNIFIIRSTIAVSICAFSIRYIEKRDIIRFLLCFFVSCLFHLMSIVWIGAYFLYDKKEFRKAYYLLLIFAAIFSSNLTNVILKITSYMGQHIYSKIYSYISYGINRTFSSRYDITFSLFKAVINILFLLVTFTYIIHRKRKINLLQNEENMFNLYLIGSILYLFSLFTSLALSRVALLYNVAQYFMLPEIFSLPEISKRKNVKTIIFILFTLYLYIRMNININSNNYVPFTLIF